MAKKPAAKKRKTNKPPASAAQKNAPTKAQSIRDMANKLGKKARPKDIIAALGVKGITVTSPQVSMTLKAAGLRRGRRRSRKVVSGVNGSRRTRPAVLTASALFAAKDLATMLGGTEKLKEAVAALERLR